MSVHEAQPRPAPPLRLAPPLTAPDDRSLIIDITRRATAAGRNLLQHGLRYCSRFPFLWRATDWLTSVRTLLRPTTTVIGRSGMALPIWIATTPIAQHIAISVMRTTGTSVRRGLLGVCRLVDRSLAMTGAWGTRQAVTFSRAVERADAAVTTLVGRSRGWAGALSASRPHIRVVRDVALVVVVARQLRAIVPAEWRLAATALSVLTLGGHTRRWIATAVSLTRAQLRDLANGFGPSQPAAAAIGNATVAIRPTTPPRPDRPRHHR